MDPSPDAIFTQDPVIDGSMEPVPPPLPLPLSPPVDIISKTIHSNARHRMTAKKPVVIQKCEICNIELIGQVVIDAHMKGSKHAKKLKAKQALSNLIDAGQVRVNSNPSDKSGVFKCDTCNVMLNSTQQLEVHYAGAKHKANVEGGDSQQILEGTDGRGSELPAGGPSEASGPNFKAEKPKSIVASPHDLVCTVCNINVNSPQQLEQHLNSKKHQDRESGRASHRPSPYARGGGGGRGGRGGLGSHGRGGGGKANVGVPAKFASLSSSFTSGGYNNSFIKPEGGVTMPSNCGTADKQQQQGPQQPQHAAKPSPGHFGAQFKNRGNFGSLTPYVNADGGVRGGAFGGRGGAARGGGGGGGGWIGSGTATVVPHAGFTGYEGYEYDQYGYGYAGYAGYAGAEGYGYGVMPPGPPPPAF